MANTSTSPNMSMPIPVVGVDPGPQYAYDLDSCLTLIDAHDHSPGNGVPITVSGIDINADFPFNGFNATLLRAARFDPQGAPLALIDDLNEVYVSGVDLYYNDGNGNQIRITQAGSIAGAAGTITGLVPPATASYVPLSKTFFWQSDVNEAAALDAATIIIRNFSTSSNGISLTAPAVLPADYALTLPPVVPTSLSGLSSDVAGNLYWINQFDSVVGSAGQVTNGMATHSSITSAIAAISAGQTIFVLPGSYTENITINKQLQLIGIGKATAITGNISFTADYSIIEKLSFTGDLSFSAAADGNQITRCFVQNAMVYSDLGTGNYVELIQG